MSLVEDGMEVLASWPELDSCVTIGFVLWFKKKVGSCGNGNSIVWLLRYETIVTIVGLTSRFSWTHNRPIWMYLMTSILE